jgi:hypothetical protein
VAKRRSVRDVYRTYPHPKRGVRAYKAGTSRSALRGYKVAALAGAAGYGAHRARRAVKRRRASRRRDSKGRFT